MKNKIIVVTGGAGLLGRSLCKVVSRNGGVAVIADRDVVAAEKYASELVCNGGSAEAVMLDITSLSSVNELIEMIQARYGKIDAVVNNAYPRNARYGCRVEDVVYEDFCENVSLHLGGYFLVTQQFCRYFCQQGYGNVVNMASIYGVIAPCFDIYENAAMTMPVEYAAIKAAIIHLTRYFAQYYKKNGVRVNAISPGGILDKQPDVFLKKYNAKCGKDGMLCADDVAGMLLFLLSDMSAKITGQNIVIDDGFSL